MAKKKKPAKKPTKKPAPAKKKPPRKPSPQKKAPSKPKPAAPSAGAAARGAHSAMSFTAAAAGLCTINQPDGMAPLPLGPISVVVTVNQPATQVCGVKAAIVTVVPGDPLQPTAGAIELMRDMMDPTKWNGVLGVPMAGNYTVLAWPCTITDRCTRAIQVMGPTPPPPPPLPPPPP